MYVYREYQCKRAVVPMIRRSVLPSGAAVSKTGICENIVDVSNPRILTGRSYGCK